eukprot:810703-Rhodomonas_salina.1
MSLSCWAPVDCFSNVCNGFDSESFGAPLDSQAARRVAARRRQKFPPTARYLGYRWYPYSVTAMTLRQRQSGPGSAASSSATDTVTVTAASAAAASTAKYPGVLTKTVYVRTRVPWYPGTGVRTSRAGRSREARMRIQSSPARREYVWKWSPGIFFFLPR